MSIIDNQFPVVDTIANVTEAAPIGEDDEFFMVRGEMDLSPYIVNGFIASKKSDFRICDFVYSRKDQSVVESQDDFLEVDNSKVAKGSVATKRSTRSKSERVAKTKAEQNKPAADVVIAQKKIASAPMSRYEKQKLKQRRQEKPQNWNQRPKIHYEWSIKPDPEWQNLREMSLNELARAELDASKIVVTEVAQRGVIPFFDKTWEKVTPRAPKVVKKSNIVHHNAGFFEDDFLTEAAGEEEVDVIATDEVLTLLMSASHTRYSWHVKVFKSDGKIIIDKTPGSIVEKMTVRECSRQNVPVIDDPIACNRPKELHDEATSLQVDVCQMMIGKDAKTFDEPEFCMEESEHQNQGRKMYKYRKIEIPAINGSRVSEKIVLMTRVEIDAVRIADGKPHYTLIKTMNEYDNKGGSYRMQLEKQPGALSAAEYRNNSPKMARWLSQAMICGADTLVIAWVTRDQPQSNKKHHLLGCSTEKIELLQQQLGVKPKNAWALLRSIIDQVRDDSCPEGEYVLVKEPLKPTMRLLYVGENEEEYESEE